MAKTLYILDGHSQIYRAYYAPFRDLSSPTGEPTKAVHVFFGMLFKMIAAKKPDYLAMAVDGPAEKLERRKLFPDYKITRKPAPDDFRPQAARIIQIVQAMGIPILAVEGHEADDIIATAATCFAGPDMDVVLVSRDKDLDQLIGPHVSLYDPMKDQTLDAAAIEAEKGYRPDQAVEVQTLCGDSTDNIPGIPGVGEKTAAKLIAKYGTADAVLAAANEQTPKLKENLLAGAATIAMSRKLVTLKRDVPLPADLAAMEFTGLSPAARPLLVELGLNALLDKLATLGVGGAPKETHAVVPPPAATDKPTTAEDFDYRCVNTPEALADMARQLKKVKRLSVDTETTGSQPMAAQLVGISLAWQSGKAFYIPVKGPLGATVLDVADVRAALGPVLADPAVEKVGQNLKFDMLVLANAGMPLAREGRMFDTMIAAYVLDATRLTYKMDALAAEFLNHRGIPIEQLIGKGKSQTTMDTVQLDVVTRYAGEDADVALRLADVLAARLEEQNLTDLFANLEMPLMPVLADMEGAGIIVDRAILKKLELLLSKQADELQGKIVQLVGHPFNVDSPKQLAVVLFEELKLPVLKKTTTGPSTDADVLAQLAVQHDLPALVLEYRRLTKLLGTYLKALAECINPRTGRIHTSFHQTGTATGRLSSSDPNLQNIPVRSEDGRQIRAAFVAPPGHLLLSADYSQVEIRMLAHLCGDETLIAGFQADEDIHRIVAGEVFGCKPEDVTPEQRSRAKTVNFGIIYGQTAHGLSTTLRIPRAEAASFIIKYRQRFPKIDEFLQACVAKAKADGYVETIFGRRRTIPDISSRNAQQRALAERLAINSVVQGSAADLIKQAMIRIAARIRSEGRPSRMLLQIHDELLFEIPSSHVDAEKEMVVAEMSGAIKLQVPLKVDAGVGPNWLEAK
ncbi:MAG: DNA polymerase I [Planctomycetota bacterium]|nr:DNA polymerase I [Planctomycetota bacterium]